MSSNIPDRTYTIALELAGGDHAAAVRFLELIVDTNRKAQALLCENFNAQDWASVASNAHCIAGSARMLDCTGLLVLAVRLETAARAAQQDAAEECFPLVMRELEALNGAIRRAFGV